MGDTKIAIQSKIATQKFPSASTIDKDENEIVESMSWHFEEWMEDRGYDFLAKASYWQSAKYKKTEHRNVSPNFDFLSDFGGTVW